MTGRVQGKVAFVTGAARGQGRSHALTLAIEGADIIAIDVGAEIDAVRGFTPPATLEDLSETVRLVEALDRRILSAQIDVRDYVAMKDFVDGAAQELGRLDIVCANAGIFRPTPALHEVSEQLWDEMIDINLKGVWNTVRASVPRLIEQGTGGSIILTSSAAGLAGAPYTGPYTASKHGVVGMMKQLANELGPYSIRVNTLHPTGVATPMILNQAAYDLFGPELDHPSLEQVIDRFTALNLLPVPFVEPIDVSQAVLYLASDESRYVTGMEMKIDAGNLVKV